MAAANPVVVMETSMGKIEIELDAKKAPISTANFLKYVDQKFYDGTVFHRVISNFMIQGGDPLGSGMGSPGYRFPDEFVQMILMKAITLDIFWLIGNTCGRFKCLLED